MLLNAEELLFFELVVPCYLLCKFASLVYFEQEFLLFVHKVVHSVIDALLFILSFLQSLDSKVYWVAQFALFYFLKVLFLNA